MNRAKCTTTRRNFLTAGAFSLAGAGIPAAEAAMERQSAGDLIRVGLILGEWPHSSGWGPMMNGINGDRKYPKRTGMIYTHVWHIKREVAEAFAAQCGIPNVPKSFDDMIGEVDGVIIDCLFQTPWIYKIAEPYLESGIPVFSDRPGFDAVWKVKKTIELAKKNNTPFWCGSSLERMYQCIQAHEHHPPETITGYETWSEGSRPITATVSTASGGRTKPPAAASMPTLTKAMTSRRAAAFRPLSTRIMATARSWEKSSTKAARTA